MTQTRRYQARRLTLVQRLRYRHEALLSWLKIVAAMAAIATLWITLYLTGILPAWYGHLSL